MAGLRRSLRSSKRGVSPLIATVLLIAFAVALGAVVMNWGRSYVEDTTKFATDKSDIDIKCSTDARIEFLTIGDEKKVCYESASPKRIEFAVRNTGTKSIYGLQTDVIATISGNMQAETKSLDLESSPLERSRIQVSSHNFTINPANASEIDQFAIVPLLKIKGRVVECTDNKIVEENLIDC